MKWRSNTNIIRKEIKQSLRVFFLYCTFFGLYYFFNGLYALPRFELLILKSNLHKPTCGPNIVDSFRASSPVPLRTKFFSDGVFVRKYCLMLIRYHFRELSLLSRLSQFAMSIRIDAPFSLVPYPFPCVITLLTLDLLFQISWKYLSAQNYPTSSCRTLAKVFR